ncbi:MAG: zinc carboxypeptidase, partial [Chthoniobacteraceae bacterium]
MDVDNVATGNGGKEAKPRDHNRDWDDTPVYPEVAAAQQRLRELAAAGRLDVFLDLHNPAPDDLRPFFFVGPPELLPEPALANRTAFLAAAKMRITGPLALDEKPRVTGPNYHPLWRQISGQWVNEHGNPHTMAACLETSWNTPASTTDGYLTVGRQLGQAVADFLHRQQTR